MIDFEGHKGKGSLKGKYQQKPSLEKVNKALIGNVVELEHESIYFTALPDKALNGNVGELEHESIDFTALYLTKL